MKFFIPSYQRPLSIKTHKLFPRDADFRVVVSSKFEASDYKLNTTIPQDKIFVTGMGAGIGNSRWWITEQVPAGEWFCMMDDNVEAVTRLLYGKDEIISFVRFTEWADRMTRMADEIGARLVGVAVVDNPFFREKQYREVGFVRGKIMLIKKSHLQFNRGLKTKEDYDFTAKNLYEYGRVLIDNWIYPRAKSYASGGCGPKSVRTTYDKAATSFLMTAYPGLFRIKEKADSAPDSEIQLRFTNLEQVEKWRKELPAVVAAKIRAELQSLTGKS